MKSESKKNGSIITQGNTIKTSQCDFAVILSRLLTLVVRDLFFGTFLGDDVVFVKCSQNYFVF